MPARGWKKHGPICKVDDCSEPSRYSGLCGMHYKRQWRHGDVNVSIIPKIFVPEICSIEDCNRPTYASNTNLCALHWQRNYRYGRTYNIIGDKGSGTTNVAGYKVLTIGGKQVYEHILLAEKALGRPLPPGAVVHHMNENKADNYTPFNLIICPNQSYHRLLHDRMKQMRTSESTKRDD